MKITTKQITNTAYVCLITGVLIGLWVLICGGYLFNVPVPNAEKAKEIQPFFTGLVAPILALGTTLLVLANLRTTTEQNFSTNFLKLIDLHNKLVENINTTVDDISSDEKPSKGRAFFDDMALRIANDFYLIDGSYSPPSGFLQVNAVLKGNIENKKGKELLIDIYDHYFQINQSDLGHYFRNLYHIVRYVERTQISDKIKIEHLKILRAQLSNYEILLLAYNGIHPYGAKFYPLIEKYEMLKNLNLEYSLSSLRTKRIVDLKILINAYPKFKEFLVEDDYLPKEYFA
jgi:hypothetical protein